MLLLRALLIGLVGAWLAVMIWGGVSGDTGLLTIHASISPSISGKTVLRFTPLGSVSAQTHHSPLQLNLSIEQIHIEQTARWLEQHKSPQQTADLVENSMIRLAVRLAYLTIIVAAVGALVACVLFRVGAKRTLAGTLVGVLGVAVPLVLAVLTYNTAGFQNATYDGEMARAPQMLDVAQQAWQRNSGIVRDIPRIASRTATLCQQLERTGYRHFTTAQPYYTVLLISDLHNNPVAIQFALDVAQTYGAKAVLVAGDFTDLGHPLEAQLLAGLKKFHCPLVGVTGNHDSRATVAALKTIPGLTLLDDGQTVKTGDLSITGFGDPAAKRGYTGSVNTSPRQLNQLSRQISRCLAHGGSPDILMVHNNDVGREAAGRVPLILDGHLHNSYVTTRRGSIIVNPGTTGAAGIRYFSAREQPCYSAAVLHFTTGSRPRLKMVDTIKMQMPSGDFSITRESMTGR